MTNKKARRDLSGRAFFYTKEVSLSLGNTVHIPHP